MPVKLPPSLSTSAINLNSRCTELSVERYGSAAMHGAQIALIDELHRLSATPKTTYTVTEEQSTLQPTHKILNISLSPMVSHLIRTTNKTTIVKGN